MGIKNPKVGEKVVFVKEKHSLSPGPRAQEISASSKGDDYSYIVEKYWRVKDVAADGMLVLVTRRGKEHRCTADDFRLRRPTFWERIMRGSKFPSLQPTEAKSEPSAS